MTGVSALFCLERLAWDVGRRVVLRVNHTRAPNGTVSHEFHGPERSLASAVERLAVYADWGSCMAELAVSSLCADETGRSVAHALGSTPARAAEWSEPLASWIIAPRVAR